MNGESIMTKPLTVLQVRNSVVHGGPETTLLGWLENIDRNKLNCPVALFRNRGGCEQPFRKTLEAGGNRVLDLPWYPGKQFRAAVNELARLIGETGARILHTHDWRSDVIGYHAAKRAGVPIVTTIYVWFNRPLKIYVSELVDALYIRRFNCVTAVCEATLKQTIDRGVPAQRCEVLISGISPKRYRESVDREAVRRRFNMGPDDIVFVYAARFYPEKAHLVLLKAFEKACGEDGRLKLLLLGNGPLEGAIRGCVAQLGISGRVVMPGFVTDIPEVLRAMDVMVHASLAEGIPLAIYEGMAARLPIIASSVDGNPEVVIPGKTGWLVPPKEVSTLAEKIIEASGRSDLRETYGRQAREFILANYSMEKATSRLESIYRRLLDRTAE